MGSIKHPKKSAGGRLGKIDAPLGKKLQAVKWGEFRLGDLFEIENTQSFNTDRLVSGNEYDYVTRTSLNQGVLQSTGFVNEENINPAGTWSLGLLQMDFFYRNKPWYAGQFVRRIVPKISIPECAILFFQTLLNRQKPILLQVLVRNVDKTFRNIAVHLPITADNQIDFDFMESFIRELEEERVRELAAYLTAGGLADTTLTASEQAALNSFDTLEWGEFNVEELFGKSTRGKRLKGDDRIEGHLPFVTAGETDTGISAFISNDVEVFSKNTTTIDMFGSAKYRNYDYGADDHVAVVHTENLDKFAAIFVTIACHKAAHNGQFNYGHNFYAKDADELNITLPICNGESDYAIMQALNSAVQKLVIKDVVAYADRKIAATKAVVGKT